MFAIFVDEYIPNSMKFSRVFIFSVFVDHGVSAKVKPTNFLTCLNRCALGLERPRKLNHKNFPSDQSAKIGPHENFLLYGILKHKKI